MAKSAPKGNKGKSNEEIFAGLQALRSEQRQLANKISELEMDFNEHNIMPRRSNIVLKGQARKMVYDVYCFMKKREKSKVNMIKLTAEATNVSVSTVTRIIKEAKDSDLSTAFKTPGKKRSGKKNVTGIDTFDQTVIKRCVHNYHITNNELPTVEKLRMKLKEDINFNGSERSLRRILEALGFRWKKAENNCRLLIEKTNIRLLRIEYLKKITKYRREGRPIIYTDESCIDLSHSCLESSSDESTKGLKKPISKGQGIFIVHAGSEGGFVPNALFLFKADMKSDSMNYDNYEKWLLTQLLPNLPSNSVVVVDDASYHNKQYDPAPTANSRKSDMLRWLSEKSIQYDKNMLKPQLYKLIKLHKEQHTKFSIDKLLAEHNHSVLRLPPYHPDLNPFEMAWAAIKGYVSTKNIKWNTQKVMELVKEKVTEMDKSEWKKLCQKVKEIEAEYTKSDHVVDIVTDQFIIFADNDIDSDDSEEEDDDEPTPNTSSASVGFNIKTEISFLPKEECTQDSDSD